MQDVDLTPRKFGIPPGFETEAIEKVLFDEVRLVDITENLFGIGKKVEHPRRPPWMRPDVKTIAGMNLSI